MSYSIKGLAEIQGNDYVYNVTVSGKETGGPPPKKKKLLIVII